MAIDITCDECGNSYRVSDDKAGAKVKCRECGAKIEVPGDDDDLFDTEADTRSSRSTRRRKKSGGPPTGLIVGVGAAVALVVVAGLAFMMMRAGNNAPPNVAQGGPFPPPPVVPPNNPDVVKIGSTTLTKRTEPLQNTLPANPAPQGAGGLPSSPPANNVAPGAGLPSSPPLANNNPGEAAAPPNNAAPMNPVAQLPGGKKFGGFANGDKEPDSKTAETPDVPLPDNWTVTADPPKVETKVDGKTIGIKFPKGSGQGDILYPTSPSVFVALGANNGFCQTREVWNLATKSKLGTVTGNIQGHWPVFALSPDGQHLATNHGLNGKDASVAVWVCKTGKSLGELEAGANVTNVMFAGTTRLIGFCQDGSAKVWKLPAGDIEHELKVEKGNEPNTAATSPGGNFLAVVTDKTALKMYDLNKGEFTGELALPFADAFFLNKPEAMSFSPDGVELGLIMPTGGFERALLIYNVADGKLLTKAQLNMKDIWGGGPPPPGNLLEWFPDRSKLLWKGHHVLDARMGGPVWSAPNEHGSSDAPRKILAADKILVVIGGPFNPELKVAPVPVAEIAAAAKVVSEGGEASDAGLPPVMKADASAFTPISLGGGAAWSMKPDGSPPGQKVKTGMPVPKERSNLGGIYISRPHVGRAILWHSDGASNLTSAKPMTRLGTPPPSHGPGTVDIDIYNLSTGKVQASVPIPHPCAVLDVGPEGDCVVVRTSKPNEERADVYALPSGKPIAGWRPHMDQHSAFRGIKHAVMIDPEYCVTQAAADPLNTHGPAYLWKLPECKAVWRLEAADSFCLSPGGKYLGFAAQSRYFFIEARTGTVVGEIPLPFPKVQCVFHPTGTHIAMLNADEVSHQVSIIDVATGKPTAEFFVPHGTNWVQWCGDTHLLLDDQWLIDLKQQKYAWQYELKFGAHALKHPDGRHWFVASSGLGDNNAILTGAVIPEPTVAARIDGTQLPDETLLKPGMQFGLQVNASAPPPAPATFPVDVGNNFKTGLERNGFAVAQNSPYMFTITTTPSNPNEPPMKFGNGGPFDPRVEVPILNVTCEVALLHNGQAVWKNTKTLSNRSFMVFLPEGEQIGPFLTKQVWGGAVDHLTKFPVPKQAFGFQATAGLGQSLFVPGGTQPAGR